MPLMYDEMGISDLEVFCAALPGRPTKAGVIRQAVEELIARELANNDALRQRFNEIKRQRSAGAERGLRVVK